MSSGHEELRTVAGSSEAYTIPLRGWGPAGDDPPPGITGVGGELSAEVGPGGGLPAAFSPTIAYVTPFSGTDPHVTISWAGSATTSLQPGSYDVWITALGSRRRAARLTIETGPGGQAATLLVGQAEADALTSGALLSQGADADAVVHALALGTGDLIDRLARRYAIGHSGRVLLAEFQTARGVLESVNGLAALADSRDCRLYASWRAVYHLTHVITSSDAMKSTIAMRASSQELAGAALGRIVVDVPDLGEIRMTSSSIRAVR